MSTEAKRIQLRRTKGWRKPDGAIVVARPSKWGNPFRVEHTDPDGEFAECGPYFVDDGLGVTFFHRIDEARFYAAECFRLDLTMRELPGWPTVEEIRDVLAGHDLACWCPLDQPCHADVLLELANRSQVES